MAWCRVVSCRVASHPDGRSLGRRLIFAVRVPVTLSEYCSSGSTSSSSSLAACQQSTTATACSASAGWIWPSSSTCSATPTADPCKQFSSSCATCAQGGSAYNCGWCSSGSSYPSDPDAACSISGYSTCMGSFQQPAGGVGQTCDASPPSPAHADADADADDEPSGSTNFVSAQQANVTMQCRALLRETTQSMRLLLNAQRRPQNLD